MNRSRLFAHVLWWHFVMPYTTTRIARPVADPRDVAIDSEGNLVSTKLDFGML